MLIPKKAALWDSGVCARARARVSVRVALHASPQRSVPPAVLARTSAECQCTRAHTGYQQSPNRVDEHFPSRKRQRLAV